MPVIGYLSVGSPETDNIPGRLVAFRRGLDEAGYVEDRNVAIKYRWAGGHNDRLLALAADLVGRQESVIVAPGAPVALAAKAATSTIPIAFIAGIDPVEPGLVASLNRPGGNITGVSVLNADLAGRSACSQAGGSCTASQRAERDRRSLRGARQSSSGRK